ncbi:diguanylate cyclase [Altererythrobacter aurantiacus]|uniref:diguanylate cyclase n=1 Tax=Parapontixanthobacter aurantiacus TaxID=1463599 RepID=A0A844ZHR7_9SPHN|nr:GGDEF domain-containing protein [Parapontixanthobacter aurantiacus]MXO86487.1 diguanylate cyclase [Parapontixanthobacter aurantiacus]
MSIVDLSGSEALRPNAVPGDPTLRYLQWPDDLRHLWQVSHRDRVKREIRFLSLLGLATCLLCLFLDAMAGMLQLGLLLRVGLVTPAYLCSLWLLKRDERLVLFVAAIIPPVLFAGAAAYLGMRAEAEHQDNYIMAGAMLVSVCIILGPLRFTQTIFFAVSGFIAVAAPILALSENLAGDVSLIVFALFCSTLPLLISRRSERLNDTNFLLTIQSRQAQNSLLAANRELEKLSDQDALTGVLNRRGFERKFQAAFQAAQASGEPLAVLLMDLDHFKQFNDTYGHQLGDECLIRVGSLLDEEVSRHHGISGRYGGEEFIAALSGSGSANAIGIAERLRRKIVDLRIHDHAGDEVSVTASVGVRIGRVANLDRVQFVQDADKALYRAKSEGRNTVVLFSGNDAIQNGANFIRENERPRYLARSA